MGEKSTTIKERVLLLSEQQTVSKTKFFTELGQSYSSFTGRNKKTAVPSDFLSRLLVKYPQCNSHWLLTGKGEMIMTTKKVSDTDIKILEAQNNDLNKLIETLKLNLNQQNEQILELKKQLQLLKGDI